MAKRPWRTEFFACFVGEIAAISPKVERILELGSGPGFLAERLLCSINQINYVALDFSAAMHDLARARLGELAEGVTFIERSFKEEGWPSDLGEFQCVVTNQAVHELRHKRHAVELHRQVRTLLTPGGVYLVCDHFAGDGGMKNDDLYMSVAEQEQALQAVGFASVKQVVVKGGLVLHGAA
jgi:SAM-dependent methyltransferase